MTDQLFEVHIRQILDGNTTGLSEIYVEYSPMIYSVIYEILKNPQNAEDVTSDFFIRLWQQTAATYRFGGKHRAWLITIAHNMAIDFLRKNRPMQSVDELLEAGSSVTMSVSSSDEDILTKLTLKQALATLDEGERQIINMKIMGELTFREISLILQKPIGTVTWKYANAIKKLRRYRYE